MQAIIAEGKVQKMAENLFRQNTRLWLVKPEFGFAKIRNLETILTGSYIDIEPGDGELKTDFVLLPDVPTTDSYAGLNIVLETPHLGSLNKNSPVYYRQIQVGQVTGFELSPSSQQVWVRVNIHPAYVNLVHNGTRFWSISGIRASWGLFSGFDFDSESMEAIIAGGIALATPTEEKMGEPAVGGDHFILHEKSEQTWLDWNPVIMLNEESQMSGRAEQPENPSTMER
jgi:paraquat-inducible protein B